METKHTPGPWLRDGNMIYSLMHAGWRKGEELFKNRFHAYVQADRECPDEEHEANVKLIAAAPELLEAVSIAYSHLTNPMSAQMSNEQLAEMMLDAIKKATK